jgi:hypothetical protein
MTKTTGLKDKVSSEACQVQWGMNEFGKKDHKAESRAFNSWLSPATTTCAALVTAFRSNRQAYSSLSGALKWKATSVISGQNYFFT